MNYSELLKFVSFLERFTIWATAITGTLMVLAVIVAVFRAKRKKPLENADADAAKVD